MDALSSILTGIGAFSAVALPMTYGTFIPQSGLWGGRVIWRWDSGLNQVALTFDDGPTAPYTGDILDMLENEGVKGTFFVLGENVQKHPELLRRMHDEGHAIGNHTWSHPHYGWTRGLSYWRDEIRRTDDLVQHITGTRPALFRPPLGAKNFFTLRAARRLGHLTVTWSKRSFDGVRTTPQQIIQRLSDTRAGDIVLLHDGIASNNIGRDPSATVSVVRPLIHKLRERDLNPATVTQMLRTPRA